jgi:hypothetical protein
MSSKKNNQSFRNVLIVYPLLVGAMLTTGATFGAVVAWEYKCVDTNRKDATHGYVSYLETKFNALGEYGWEMVGYAMNNGSNVRYVCFKRKRGDYLL